MTQDFRSEESKFEQLDYLTCATRLAQSLYGDACVEITEAIALQYVEAGQLERAVEQAELMTDAYARDSILARITPIAVASGDDDYALELLETIDDPILHNSAIENMSIEFARRGKFDTALELADQASDNDSTLGSIAALYWQSGQKNEAVELARSIEFDQQRAITLAQLAKLSDEKEESQNLLTEAQKAAEQIESAEPKVYALLPIASVYEERADRERSLEILNRALEVCDDFENAQMIGLSGSFARDDTLLQIVEAFLRLDELSKATEIVEEMEDQFIFARGNLALAVASGKGQEGAGEAKLLDEAATFISELEAYSNEEAGQLDGLIAELAQAYANRGRYPDSRRMIQSTRFEPQRVFALKQLGKLCGSAGHDRALFEIELDLPNPYEKAQYWLGIYDSTRANHAELSERALTKALTNAESLEQPVEKAEVFTEIALTLAKSQRAAEAEEFFSTATNATILIGGNFLRARAFLRLAKASQEVDRRPNQNEMALLQQFMIW